MRQTTRLFAALLLTTALPASAETIRSSEGVAAVLTLSDELTTQPTFAAFLREEALALREDAALIAAEDGIAGAALTVEDKATFANRSFASVLRRVASRMGGPELVTVEALTWDVAAQDFARLDRFFDEGQPRDEALIVISHRLREGIRENVFGGKIPDQWRPLVEQAITPDVAVLSNFTLAPGTAPGRAAGLTFHFSPQEIAPANRPLAFTLPAEIFALWLNAEGRALFGGALTR